MLTYAAPVIEEISGCSASSSSSIIDCSRLGGNMLLIRGRNFGVEGATVTVGGIPCTFVIHDLNQPHRAVRCQLPAGTTSRERVVITQRYGASSSGDFFVSYVQCGQGTFQQGYLCQRCVAGEYNNRTGTQVQCLQCAPGTHSPNQGSTACLACPPGTYSPLGSAKCLSCPRGTFSSVASDRCVQCVPGTYASQEGSTSCAKCGTNAEQTVDYAYCQCRSGYYLSLKGECEPCMIGGNCVTPGTTVYTVVSLDSYSPSAIQSSVEHAVRVTMSVRSPAVTTAQQAAVRSLVTKVLFDSGLLPQERVIVSSIVSAVLPPDSFSGAKVELLITPAFSSNGLLEPSSSSSSTTTASSLASSSLVSSSHEKKDTITRDVPAPLMTMLSTHWVARDVPVSSDIASLLDILMSLFERSDGTVAPAPDTTNGSPTAPVGDSAAEGVFGDAYSGPPALDTDFSRRPVSSFQECYHSACISGNQCRTGHTGNMCTVCEAGYGRKSTFTCEKCRSPVARSFYLTGSILAAILICFVLAYKQIVDGRKSTNELPAPAVPLLFKIGVSGIQVFAIASRYDVYWPGILGPFFSAMDVIGGLGTTISTLDCFLSASSSIRPIWVTSIAIMLLPLMGILLPLAVLLPSYLYNRRSYKEQVRLALKDQRRHLVLMAEEYLEYTQTIRRRAAAEAAIKAALEVDVPDADKGHVKPIWDHIDETAELGVAGPNAAQRAAMATLRETATLSSGQRVFRDINIHERETRRVRLHLDSDGDDDGQDTSAAAGRPATTEGPLAPPSVPPQSGAPAGKPRSGKVKIVRRKIAASQLPAKADADWAAPTDGPSVSRTTSSAKPTASSAPAVEMQNLVTMPVLVEAAQEHEDDLFLRDEDLPAIVVPEVANAHAHAAAIERSSAPERRKADPTAKYRAMQAKLEADAAASAAAAAALRAGLSGAAQSPFVMPTRAGVGASSSLAAVEGRESGSTFAFRDGDLQLTDPAADSSGVPGALQKSSEREDINHDAYNDVYVDEEGHRFDLRDEYAYDLRHSKTEDDAEDDDFDVSHLRAAGYDDTEKVHNQLTAMMMDVGTAEAAADQIALSQSEFANLLTRYLPFRKQAADAAAAVATTALTSAGDAAAVSVQKAASKPLMDDVGSEAVDADDARNIDYLVNAEFGLLYESELYRARAVRKERAIARLRTRSKREWYARTYGPVASKKMIEELDAKQNGDRPSAAELRHRVDVTESRFLFAPAELIGFIVTSITVVMFVIHPNIAKQFLTLVSCTEIGGTDWEGASYFLGDMTIRCWSRDHLLFFLLLGLPMGLIWVVGLPVFASWYLYRNRNLIQMHHSGVSSVMRKQKMAFESRMAFLYRGYRVTRYYWFLLELFRKVALVAIPIFFPGQLHTQLILAALVVFLFIAAQVWARPFENKVTEFVEYFSLFSSFMIFFLANFLFIDSVKQTVKDTVKWFIVLILIFFLASLLVAFILLAREELELGPLRVRIYNAHVAGDDVQAIIRQWRIARLKRKMQRSGEAELKSQARQEQRARRAASDMSNGSELAVRNVIVNEDADKRSNFALMFGELNKVQAENGLLAGHANMSLDAKEVEKATAVAAYSHTVANMVNSGVDIGNDGTTDLLATTRAMAGKDRGYEVNLEAESDEDRARTFPHFDIDDDHVGQRRTHSLAKL
jgi:hypothetical protein